MSDSLTVSTADGDFACYVAKPQGAPSAAIIVIQEIFGVNDVMRGIADRYAEAGFLAVAPDLFWRLQPGVQISDKREAEWKQAFDLMNRFDVDQGVQDIQATIAKVRELPECTGKVGAVGFCLGGLLAFLTATRTDADASVGFYGVGIENRTGEADMLAHPLMLHIAEEDSFVPKPAQQLILSKLQNHPQVEVFTYPGRDHAFAREGGDHYDAADADKAQGRTVDFFRKHLG